MIPFWGTRESLPGPPRSWSCREIILSVIGEPHWEEFAARLSMGLIAEAMLEDSGREFDQELLQAAAERFRRAEGLLSAEQTQEWLESQDLSAEEWERFLVRRELLRAWGPRLEAQRVDLSSHPSFGDAFFAEALCSDYLPDARFRFSKLLALASQEESPPLPDVELRAAQLDARYPWMGGITARELGGVQVVLDVAEARIAERTSHEKIGAMMLERGLDWTHFDCQVVHLRDPGVADELLLCIHRDREALVPTLAHRAGAEVTRRSFFLQDVPEHVRSRLLGAQAGEVVGPVDEGTGASMLLVERRRAPSLEDEQLVAMARGLLERKILDEAWVGSLRRGGVHG